ncbi:hypothetical protein [Hallella colorans]|uniref:hypothetical protein n=1 Tax=Hallella colorans TaxID=1703337 RepID=UPI00288A9761|nr:hypothetical protein [Hallella colorans]
MFYVVVGKETFFIFKIQNSKFAIGHTDNGATACWGTQNYSHAHQTVNIQDRWHGTFFVMSLIGAIYGMNIWQIAINNFQLIFLVGAALYVVSKG